MAYEKQTWIDGQSPLNAERMNHIEDGLDAAHKDLSSLSEEIVKQATPEMFGATGDGVTDDAEAIAQALASGKNVVFDGAKTYAVGSTITIPADSIVDFRGATVVPMGNHDVIQVKPGCCFENLVVRCTDVPGWDSSAMVFYGGDYFRASNPTRINNVKLYNDVTYNDGVENKGNGLRLYVDEPGQLVEGLAIDDLLTTGFGKGVFIEGLDPEGEYALHLVAFIGANNFTKYWSFKDTYGIYIGSGHDLDRVTSNFFSDLNIQSGGHGNSRYAIYCNGFNNYFSGCVYDYFYLNPRDPVKAIFFGKDSNSNVVETSSGVVYESGFVTDYGIRNRVVKRAFEDFLSIPNSSYDVGMIGNQDDILAFADRHMDCTLESLDAEPAYGSLANVFDPTPIKTLTYRASVSESNDRRARITINFRKSVNEITNIIMQFSRRCVPSNIKITIYGATEAREVYDTAENVSQTVVWNYSMSMYPISSGPVMHVAKIVIEIGGFANPEGNGATKIWTLERIMATANSSTGKAWMRCDGGEVYGNIKFQQERGVVLSASNGNKYMLVVSDDGTLSTREYVEQEEEPPEVAALIPTMAASTSWYNADLAGAEQNTITSIEFNANYEPTGNEDASWPCDEDGDGLIMAYRAGTNIVIAPTTGSDKIRLNADSSYMFANDGTKANFAALTSIAGTEMWATNSKTSISNICTKTPIVSPVAVPAGVNDMSNAFTECRQMTSPPVLPKGVTSMANAFSKCSGMTYFPEIPSTVTNMNYAFMGCALATNAPSVIPKTVTSMAATFRLCGRMNGTIEINAENVKSYTQCFDGVCSTSGAVTLTGSCPQLTELAATNTQGKVTVAN